MYFYQKIIYYFCIFIGMCLEPRRMDDRYPEITMVKMFASFTISHNIDSLFIELESIMLSNTQGKLLLEIRKFVVLLTCAISEWYAKPEVFDILNQNRLFNFWFEYIDVVEVTNPKMK